MPTLSASIRAAVSAYPLGDRIMLRFELTNNTDHDLYVLKWFTPLEGIRSDCVEISLNGRSVDLYDGPHLKRAAPHAGDLELVAGGATLTVDFALAETYRI